MKKFFAIVAIVAFAACNSAESTGDGKDTTKKDTIPATPLNPPAKDTTKKDSIPPVAKKDTMPSKDTSKAAKKK